MFKLCWVIDMKNIKKEKTMTEKIKLGDLIKDKITGIEGTAIAKTEWLNGCVRWCYQPMPKQDDLTKYPDSITLDEAQLEVVKPANEKPVQESVPIGGPSIKPKQKEGPKR